MRRMPVVRGTAAVMAFFTLTTVSASTLMFTYSGAINKALNINTSKIVETDDASAVNTPPSALPPETVGITPMRLSIPSVMVCPIPISPRRSRV